MLLQYPVFSIIIPTYNRPERLATCLESITHLNYPSDRFEVIVVDDGSKVSLDSVVKPFQDTLNLTLLRQTNAGPATARNTGATHAKGKFLAFTDDDCQLDPNWLKNIETHLTEDQPCLLGGKTINALPDNIFSTASQLLIDYLYFYYNTDSNQAQFFASNNFVVPAQIFRQIGKFDTTFPLAAGEDRELCDRWLYRGYLMQYIPEAKVYHAHHLTLRRFWRQHFNYGRGAFHFHQIRAGRGHNKIEVEPWYFYYKLLTYPLSQASLGKSLIISTLFFVSQVANVLGFFREKYDRIWHKLVLSNYV
ncbi:glycosyl transferase family 2 [Gloeothece citriformis PCC 7424]|uniref:Glycosyl transferase family 2 n=1 Tax=Gloeothece citriformis (strain PCC 7424) TaxID=65393 RepID=B7KLK2_GLOC7|nr:glycosyltransferase [Gloeothece citriformis]ACK72574.1 glycosyl transferase family 2 [Gloeothece citriformis PCC 7424]